MKRRAALASVDVTVVIVSWNSEKWLAQCLHQLMAQTLSPRAIIVVDNASTDDSAGVAASFEQVQLIRAGANLGFAAGNNLALNQCTTEFVALLNPDAFVEPDWLEQLITAACQHPEAAAFGSRQLTWSAPDILDGTGDAYHMSGLVWRTRWGADQQPEDLRERAIFSPCAAAALYRRAAVAEVGGFDDDYFCYVEDVDLGFRLQLAGYQALYVPQAVVQHVGSATTGGSHSDFCVFHGHRNVVWTYVKNMPLLLFWLFLPLHLLFNLAALVRFSLSGQTKVIFRAKVDALRGLPAMWCKRRNIQRRRKLGTLSIFRLLDTRLWPSRK